MPSKAAIVSAIQDKAFSFDGIDTNISGGLSFLMALPANLSTGDSFRIQSPGRQPRPPHITQNFLDYTVAEEPTNDADKMG